MADLTREQIERGLLAWATDENATGLYAATKMQAEQVCRQLLAAMDRLEAVKAFVPKPEEMSGYGDPDAPDNDEEELKRIREWDYNDFPALMDFIRGIWWMASWGWKQEPARDELEDRYEVMRYDISTGGWSGNESIIDALQENSIFWALSWIQSRRGGHFIFEVRKLESTSAV